MKFSFWDYLRENLRHSFAVWERGEAMGVLTGLLFAAVFAVLSVFGVQIIVDEPTASLFWQAGIITWFLCLLLIITPYRMWRDKCHRITSLENAAVPKLIIRGRYADQNYRAMDRHQSQRTYICEIEVRNLSKTKRISDVSVTIEEFDGDRILDLPQTLLPKDQSINAGTSKAWEVVRGSHVALGEEIDLQLNIEYRGRKYRVIGNKPYEMTFRASGADTASVTKRFRLDFDESKRPMLIPLDG